MTALIPRLRREAQLAAEEYALSPSAAPGRVRGRPLPRRSMRSWPIIWDELRAVAVLARRGDARQWAAAPVSYQVNLGGKPSAVL